MIILLIINKFFPKHQDSVAKLSWNSTIIVSVYKLTVGSYSNISWIFLDLLVRGMRNLPLIMKTLSLCLRG